MFVETIALIDRGLAAAQNRRVRLINQIEYANSDTAARGIGMALSRLDEQEKRLYADRRALSLLSKIPLLGG